RSAGLDFVTGLPDDCFSCVMAGHGQGALQDEVRASSIVSSVSTLDNQYLSAYWDFGIVGLVALLAIGLVAVRRLLRSAELPVRAGAVGVLGVLVAGAFYDTLYLSTGAILVGFLLASMTRPPARRAARADAGSAAGEYLTVPMASPPVLAPGGGIVQITAGAVRLTPSK
ncbi:MAG: hypothetical protein ABJA16_10925, partial [Nakamurella sp.]